jgi:hypothetical protein
MDLPIKFPSDEEVIAEEAARFRALTPDDRVRELGDMVRTYHFLMAHSGCPELLARLAEEEESRGRKAIQEFVSRHT